jgi:superfamily I DNA/RNA helicase
LGEEGALVMETYYRLSTGFKALDWDQVVVCANQICEELPMLPRWLGSIKHFLIDEYQDFNPAEQRFLREIMTGAGTESAVVVGDDDQSLYSGRGASPKGIVELASAPHVDKVSLVVTYRCLSEIVSVANRFLRYMREEPEEPRELVPHKSGGRVSIKAFKSAKAESDFLADYVRSRLRTIRLEASNRTGIACLFPSWRVLNQYQKELEKRGVLCSVQRTGQPTEQEMWVRVLARLAVLCNQPLLERVLLTRFPAIKPRHQRQVIAKLLSNGCGISEAVALAANSGHWDDDARFSAMQYENFIKELVSGDPSRVSACFEWILNGVGKCDCSVIKEFLETADESSLEDAIDCLVMKIFREGMGQRRPATRAVELMTMHGAKGLTRRYIVIPACEECWLPGNVSDAQLPERKRLFYVAITRATDEVVITYPCRRARGDSLNYELPGRFTLSRFAEQLGI